MQVELAVDAGQVVLDRLRTEEDLRPDLPIRQALRDERRDLELLRCQLFSLVELAPRQAFARRAQLGGCGLVPRSSPKLVEYFERCSKVRSRVPPAIRPAEALAVASSVRARSKGDGAS